MADMDSWQIVPFPVWRYQSTTEQRPSITCPNCGRTSYHPEDVRLRYCGHCHVYHNEFGSDR